MAESDTCLSSCGALALVGAIMLGAFVGSPLHATPDLLRVSGHAVVVDGDTLDVEGVRVRLEGIDAPEAGQTCARRWFGTWKCGSAATRALSRLIGGQPVDCKNLGADKYGRTLGHCTAAGRDINADMVRGGHAWAFVKYSTAYTAQESEARALRLGIWQAETEPAWIYRERGWRSAETSAPNGCAIKGNVSEHGRIYHMPWNPWYAKVRVEAAKGERWFCTEAEAASAGFRPSKAH